ncbi:MFS transporter [candidate division KSB1 bacterium]|nr:MAG: MFS transporter [candidate division KSB1 bacterium]
MIRGLPKGLWPLGAAGFISTAGDSLHQVAIMWLIYELTGSTVATGLIGMAQYLPAVIASVFAGALVDRLNRKHVMILSDAARIALVALIPTLYLLGRMNGLLLGLLAFSIAIFTTLFFPARESIVPQIVAKHELTRAGSILQTSYGMAYFVGPLLAAAILPWAKLTGLFYADAATYAASLAFLFFLRPRPIAHDSAADSTRSVRAGLTYAKSHGLIRGLLLVTAVDNLFIMGPAMVGTPLYVRLHLGLGAQAYAATEAAFALGMIAGSLLVNRVAKRLPRGRMLLYAIMFDGITFVPLFFVHSLLPSLVVWFIHSIGVPFILVPRSTLVQTEVPSHLQGRVFSLIYFTVVGLSAVSSGLTGIIASVLPTHILFAVIGVSATLVGAAGWFIRDLRDAP